VKETISAEAEDFTSSLRSKSASEEARQGFLDRIASEPDEGST